MDEFWLEPLNLTMANSPKDLGLLAGTFLVGLGALEMMMHAFGL
jgi:hypothetical protein